MDNCIRTKTVEILAKNYGITTVPQLLDAITNMKKIDISIFVERGNENE